MGERRERGSKWEIEGTGRDKEMKRVMEVSGRKKVGKAKEVDVEDGREGKEEEME